MIYSEVFFQPRTLEIASMLDFNHPGDIILIVLILPKKCPIYYVLQEVVKMFHLDFALNLPSLFSNLGILNDDLNGTRRGFPQGTIHLFQVKFDRQKAAATGGLCHHDG